MSLIGFRREDGDIEYLEEVEYSEEHLEDDLHTVIREDPRLVMGTLTSRENIVLGSKVQLPTGKEPDLLTCDKRGTVTVVEFKRDRSPRPAVTQLFDYASSIARLRTGDFLELAGYDSIETLFDEFKREEESDFDLDDFERDFTESLNSPQLMLVAYTITDDVRRMTRWLREAHELKINCVEFDYYEKDDAEMFVPTVIGLDETREIKEREEKPRERKYRQFYSEILEEFKQRRPGVTNSNGSSDKWHPIPVGHQNVEGLWDFKGNPGEKVFTVGMRFQLDDSQRNQELLNIVLDELEGTSMEIDEEIQSGEYGGSGYTEFYIQREVGRLDDALEDDELKSWGVEKMAAFHQTLKPLLDEELA